MKLFEAFGDDLNYKDILQVDGAFAVAHVNSGKSPEFNGVSGKVLAESSRKGSLSSAEEIENVFGCLRDFNGVEKNCTGDDQESLWESFWLEYIDAFNVLTKLLPKSVVTIFLGRQAVEIGFKYLLLKKTGEISFTHDLGKLSELLFSEYEISDEYLEYVDAFCESYSEYVEGGNAEYFRYPEYRDDAFFAGNSLDIEWLSYNFALILLKLLHLAGLDNLD